MVNEALRGVRHRGVLFAGPLHLGLQEFRPCGHHPQHADRPALPTTPISA